MVNRRLLLGSTLLLALLSGCSDAPGEHGGVNAGGMAPVAGTSNVGGSSAPSAGGGGTAAAPGAAGAGTSSTAAGAGGAGGLAGQSSGGGKAGASGTAGTSGGTAGADGGMAGANGGAAGANGGAAGASGGSAGGSGSTSPKIFYASDSTVRHYESNDAMQQGVGQRLPEFFANNVSVANYARGGRAISSFLNEGIWGNILKAVRPGDYVLIQFGINDRGDVPDKEVFKNYLRTYVADARQREAIPVFVTPTPRLQYDGEGVFTNAFTKYCEAKLEVGAELGVTVIDLQSKGRNFYTEIGPSEVESKMMIDSLHLRVLGAYHMARLVAEGIAESKLSPLNTYVLGGRLDSKLTPVATGWSPRAGYSHF